MSIEHMSAIWRDDYYGQADKAKLLVALAIADTANGDGFAFPSVDFIARKARSSVRSVQDLCREMERDGKLEIQVGSGRNGTNLYRITPPQPLHPQGENTERHPAAVAPRNGCTPQPSGGGSGALSGGGSGAPLHPNHKEPPMNRQERSGTPTRVNARMAGFDEFYQAYPKKKKKPSAQRAWQKHGCSAFLEVILSRLAILKTSLDWTKDRGQYIPYPASWLNERGWEDELPVAVATPNGTTPAPEAPKDPASAYPRWIEFLKIYDHPAGYGARPDLADSWMRGQYRQWFDAGCPPSKLPIHC